MKCPSCSFLNREGLRFCENCGAGLPAVSAATPASMLPAGILCQNCGAQNRAGAQFCGKCGTSFVTAINQQQRNSTTMNSGKNSSPILLGSFIGVLVLGLIVAGVLFFRKDEYPSAPAVPQMPQVVVVTIEPLEDDSAQPKVPPTQTNRPLPTVQLQNINPAPQQVNRCPLFEGLDMSVVYMDWKTGAPLSFYVKMPGGVIGLEKNVAGDTQPWEYSVKIGSDTTRDCSVLDGYKDRLYCIIDLYQGYAGTYQSFDLFVNGCSESVFTNFMNDLPALSGK